MILSHLIPISTHAPRVRRDEDVMGDLTGIKISTHAPRVRRDDNYNVDLQSLLETISTHAPRVRRDFPS